MGQLCLLLFMAIGTLGSENDVTQTSEEARNQAETWHSNNFMYNYPMYTGMFNWQVPFLWHFLSIPNVYYSIGTIRQNRLLLSYNAWQHSFWFYGGKGRKSWYRIQSIQCRDRRTNSSKENIFNHRYFIPFYETTWASMLGIEYEIVE